MNKKRAKILAICLSVLILLSGTLALYILTLKNQQSSANEIRIACIGDSLTQSSGYPYYLWQLLGSNAPYVMGNSSINPKSNNSSLTNGTHFGVGNFGVGSTTVLLNTETPYMNTSVFQDALRFNPDIVIIMLGTNDAQPNLEKLNTSFVGDYLNLITSFRALSSHPKIWVALPPPIFSAQSGKLDPEYFKNTIISDIKQVANLTNLKIIDVYSAVANYANYFPDGEHPNNEGAELIATEIYRAITH